MKRLGNQQTGRSGKPVVDKDTAETQRLIDELEERLDRQQRSHAARDEVSELRAKAQEYSTACFLLMLICVLLVIGIVTISVMARFFAAIFVVVLLFAIGTGIAGSNARHRANALDREQRLGRLGGHSRSRVV